MLRSVPLWHPVPLAAITARSQRVLERNPGVDVWMPVLSALAVVNSNHLFSSPSLLPLSFSPLLLFNCPVLPPHPAFLLILWPLSLCLPSLLEFHVASFCVHALIITLFCTSNPSSCPARSPSTALWYMGLWRALILLPAPLSLQLATRSKVCVWLFPPFIFSLFY